FKNELRFQMSPRIKEYFVDDLFDSDFKIEDEDKVIDVIKGSVLHRQNPFHQVYHFQIARFSAFSLSIPYKLWKSPATSLFMQQTLIHFIDSGKFLHLIVIKKGEKFFSTICD
ncbi:hypothetical protein ACFL35_22010, partial [Candidatus Riflebacteria bacterium]